MVAPDRPGPGRGRPGSDHSTVADASRTPAPSVEQAGGRRAAIVRVSPPGRAGQDVASGGASSNVEVRRLPVFFIPVRGNDLRLPETGNA